MRTVTKAERSPAGRLDTASTGRPHRRCAIAARLGHELACPEGGCRLARELGLAPDPDALWPCPLEVLALRAPRCPLAIVTIDGLRRRLERGRRDGQRRVREERAHRRTGAVLRRPVANAAAVRAGDEPRHEG